MSQQRKKFTPEYREEAARLVIESGRPNARVADEIGVSAGLLGKWVKNERERQGNVDGMSEADLRAENARLRRELAEARLDNEFLSKATAFFIMSSCQKQQPSSLRSNANGKIRTNAAGEGELQYQSHGKTSQSFTVWILRLGTKGQS